MRFIWMIGKEAAEPKGSRLTDSRLTRWTIIATGIAIATSISLWLVHIPVDELPWESHRQLEENYLALRAVSIFWAIAFTLALAMFWRRRGDHRFTVRTLFVGVTLISVWLGWRLHETRKTDNAIASLRRAGASYTHYSEGAGFDPYAVPPKLEPLWKRILGGSEMALLIEYRVDDSAIRSTLPALQDFGNTIQITFHQTKLKPETLRDLSALENVRAIQFYNLPLNDQCLSQLQRMTKLREIDFVNVDASEESIWRLRAAIPKCDIDRRSTLY